MDPTASARISKSELDKESAWPNRPYGAEIFTERTDTQRDGDSVFPAHPVVNSVKKATMEFSIP